VKLEFNFKQKITHRLRKIAGKFKYNTWFPHIPLFLIIFAIGLFNLISTLNALNYNVFLATTETGIHWNASHIFNLIKIASDLALMIFSFGLFLKSRMAWLITFFLITMSFTMVIINNHFHIDLLIIIDVLILIFLVKASSYFSHENTSSAVIFSLFSISGLLAYASFGSLLLGRGFSPNIKTLMGGLYFTIVTMSTVGYGDITPKSTDARVFTESVIILGITVFATSISSVLVPMIGNHVQHIFGKKKTANSNHHIILAGSSQLLINLYHKLTAEHHQVLVVSNLDLSHEIKNEHFILGDPSRRIILESAQTKKAAAIVCLSDKDVENSFIILAARELNKDIKILTIVNNHKNLPVISKLKPDLLLELYKSISTHLIESLIGESNEDDLIDRTIKNIIFEK
jgi:voltage-gated potassium channel